MYPQIAKRASGIASILSLLVGTIGPQLQAQQSASEAPPPTIRVSTRLVIVDVVVTDKHGAPITGLHPEDFNVQEKGKTQKVAFFTPPSPGSQNIPPTLGPGIYTNRPEFRSPGGPVTVLLIDAANTPFRDQAYSRQQMLKYVKEQLKPGQRMAIFALTNSLRVLQDFTSDPQLLQKALEHYKPQEPILAAGTAPPMITDTNLGIEMAENEVRSFGSIQLAYALDRRVETTLDALRSLSRILAGIPGRKNIVWLTAAFPFELIPEDRNISEAELAMTTHGVQQRSLGTLASGSVAETERQSHTQEIREAAARLSSAQVALYPVDARGLMSGMEFLPEDSANRQPLNTSERATIRMSDAAASQETMRELAAETGGKAYINQNEIKDGVALALADDSASYTLGYYPEDKKWDGKYRSIKVKVNRDGVEVRSRRGYYAIDPSQEKDKKPEQEVAAALRDNAPDTSITFSAQIKQPDKAKVGVDFLLDAHTVSAEDASGGGKKLNVAFYTATFGADGRMLGSQSQKVDQTFDAATYAKLLQQGMLLHMDVTPPTGSVQVRLAVQDNRTGFVGTIVAPLAH